ncbi:LysR family transcriptional regulator [Vibrio maerlii]|uniref:LysR family transcriptional regulator n=1 Tax=Vibrio maerlii TaxID=2231648 RepID=UPI000E3B5F10|nr:LysR family transcriptional regulator [Vibrio maerlii]
MRNEIPNFNLLAVFAAVMEQGSLSKAAEHLSTNQSTISTALARLKKEIGQELFVRSGRGVVPTAYSHSLYEQIQNPIHELNGVFRSLGTFDPKTTERKFVMTAPEHLQWLLLNEFNKRHPEALSLEVYDQPDNDEKMYDGLLTQRYDVMIDIVVPDHPSIQSTQLFEGDFVVVCRNDHPRIQGGITEEQYMKETHAVLERTRKQSLSLGHYASIDLSQRKVAYHGRSLFSNLLLCSQTDFLAVVPLSMALQFQEKLQIQIFKPPFAHKRMSNHLIWLKKMNNDPGHTWLRNELIEGGKQVVASMNEQWK